VSLPKNLKPLRPTNKQSTLEAGEVWREHGALEYRECVGDDLDVQSQVPFPRLIHSTPNETVVLAWIAFESRAHRDEVKAKIMKDPRPVNNEL
jgi:uncharacterized protein YbaA (DUF1428 family)